MFMLTCSGKRSPSEARPLSWSKSYDREWDNVSRKGARRKKTSMADDQG
jgi:hypothetical protein